MPSAAKEANLGTPSQIGIVSANNVLSLFASACIRSKDTSSNVLLNSLLQLFVVKMNGNMNAPYSSNLIDLCQAIRHKSKSAY